MVRFMPYGTPAANERIYFSRSTDAGSTWSPKQDVSLAGVNVEHAFPAIAAGAGGDVRIAWMDTRNAPLWNVYHRSSINGGNTWGAEAQVSGFVTGFDYIEAGGFDFPFGDYFQLTIDSAGLSNACWGEGLNYQTPGSIWFSKGK